jgi:hypothetical protein
MLAEALYFFPPARRLVMRMGLELCHLSQPIFHIMLYFSNTMLCARFLQEKNIPGLSRRRDYSKGSGQQRKVSSISNSIW